jgi:hypothetical protein
MGRFHHVLNYFELNPKTLNPRENDKCGLNVAYKLFIQIQIVEHKGIPNTNCSYKFKLFIQIQIVQHKGIPNTKGTPIQIVQHKGIPNTKGTPIQIVHTNSN